MPAIRARSRRPIHEINMVPFIDVMLVLLIIFMVTAPMLTPGAIHVPTVGQAAATPPQRADVLIDHSGNILLKTGDRESAVTLEELGQAARHWQQQQSEGSAVLISADKQLPFETVMAAMSALQSAGVTRVAFGVKTSQ